MTGDGASSLYVGRVMHQRLRPRRHRLAYSVFSLLVDLDELDGLASRLRLFSRNRFNLFSFHDRDHGDRSGAPLRGQVERHLHAAGLAPDGGPIRLLCMPRVLGYVFNPISIYFCHRREEAGGALFAILYEVSNTFGQRHSYLIPVAAGAGPVRQSCTKAFYVSPFLDMELGYAFRIVPPGEKLVVSICASDTEGVVLSAVHTATRRALTDAALARVFATLPLLTAKVMAGIHWEALRIWLKGVALRNRPPPPERPVSLGHAPR